MPPILHHNDISTAETVIATDQAHRFCHNGLPAPSARLAYWTAIADSVVASRVQAQLARAVAAKSADSATTKRFGGAPC